MPKFVDVTDLSLATRALGLMTVDSYADLITDTAVDGIAVGDYVAVRGGAVYEVQDSTASIASVSNHVSLTANDDPPVRGTGYHVITGGGTKLRSVTAHACPRHFGAAGDGVTDDTAAVQMAALYAADCGEFRPEAGLYLLSGAITYFGGVSHTGGHLVRFRVADSAGIDAVFIPYTWESANQAEMQSRQWEKYRPSFDKLDIDCNGTNGGADYGIILTAQYGRIENCWIQNAAEYGILVTSQNKLGDTLNNGFNLIQPWICQNRIMESLKGGVKVLDTATKCTDGFLLDNAILGGSEYGIVIDTLAGWKIIGNQVSDTLTGIRGSGANNTIVADNMVHGFGNKATVGARHGIYLAGMSSSAEAKAKITGNTISAEGNTTALADGSTYYYGIAFQGRNSASALTADVSITDNVMTFADTNGADGFAGTSTKIKAIYQNAATHNNLFGLISGNMVMSDENATGVVSDFITLHADSRIRVGANHNCGSLVEGRTVSITTSSAPTINVDQCDRFYITAQAGSISSMTTNLTGTPTDGRRLTIRVTDNGTSRAITWGASFTGNLLANTVPNATHTQELIYDSALSQWVGTILTDDLGRRISITRDFPSVAAGSYEDLSFTLSGAVVGDCLALGVPAASAAAGIVYSAWVSAANTVTVRANNYTASPVDPPSGLFKVMVVR